MREDYNEMLDKLVEELIDEIVNGREVDDDEQRNDCLLMG